MNKENLQSSRDEDAVVAGNELVDVQHESDDTMSVQGSLLRKYRTALIAGGVTLALLLAAGGYAMASVVEHGQMDQAYASAQSADAMLGRSITSAKKLSSLDASKVADRRVLDELQRALKAAQGQAGVDKQHINSVLLWQILGAKDTYTAEKSGADSARLALDKAVKAVQASVAVKQLADAKQALTDKINAAKQTLTDSDGKVQDNATRDALQKAVDAANKVLADSKATVKTLQAEPSKLDAAVNTVNQSVEAKRKADEEAAQKAAAEEAARQAAAAAAQASTPSYSGSYSGSTYTAPRSTYIPARASGGSTYTAPQSSAPSSGGVIMDGVGYGVKPGDPKLPDYGMIIH